MTAIPYKEAPQAMKGKIAICYPAMSRMEIEILTQGQAIKLLDAVAS